MHKGKKKESKNEKSNTTGACIKELWKWRVSVVEIKDNQ